MQCSGLRCSQRPTSGLVCVCVRVCVWQQRCYCGSSHCRQVVGGRSQKTADALRSDNSDQLCTANNQQLVSKVTAGPCLYLILSLSLASMSLMYASLLPFLKHLKQFFYYDVTMSELCTVHAVDHMCIFVLALSCSSPSGASWRSGSTTCSGSITWSVARNSF